MTKPGAKPAVQRNKLERDAIPDPRGWVGVFSIHLAEDGGSGDSIEELRTGEPS